MHKIKLVAAGLICFGILTAAKSTIVKAEITDVSVSSETVASETVAEQNTAELPAEVNEQPETPQQPAANEPPTAEQPVTEEPVVSEQPEETETTPEITEPENNNPIDEGAETQALPPADTETPNVPELPKEPETSKEAESLEEPNNTATEDNVVVLSQLESTAPAEIETHNYAVAFDGGNLDNLAFQEKSDLNRQLDIFAKNDKDSVKNGWIVESGKQYFYNNGEKQTGWVKIAGRKYYFDPEKKGALKRGFVDVPKYGRVYVGANLNYHTGWLNNKGNRYYLDPNKGIVWVGYKKVEDNHYFFDPEKFGAAQKGFVDVPKYGKVYFSPKDYTAMSGFIKVANKTYYAHPSNNKIRTGLRVIEGNRYYFDPDADGAMKKGFTDVPKYGKVFFKSNGQAAAGWFTRGSKKYYAHVKTNKIYSGLKSIEGNRYFFDLKTNEAKRGFVDINKYGRVYFQKDYTAAKGWFKVKNKTYYANTSNNKLYTGLKSISGERYYFDKNTYEAKRGFIDVEKYGRVYFQKNFAAAKGMFDVGKNRYYANKSSSKLKYGYLKYEGVHYWFEKTKGGAASKGIVITPKNGTFFVTSKYKNKSGWITSGGHKYYGDEKTMLMVTGVKSIDGKTYYFSKEGRLLQEYNVKSKHGIDVSAYQGVIDWAKVKASGKVDFAIIRALTWSKTAGYYIIDPYFDVNIRQAKAHGIMVGVYLFSYAFNNNEMAEEINYFVNHPVVKGHKRDGIVYDLPVFIDFEYNPALQNNPTYEGRTNMIRHGMVMLDNYGYTPGFYASQSWAINHFNAAALQNEGYDFWMARYFDNVPNKSPESHGWSGKQLAIWQYSSRGSIPGINGNVDVNHCYKDYKFTPVKASTSAYATSDISLANVVQLFPAMAISKYTAVSAPILQESASGGLFNEIPGQYRYAGYSNSASYSGQTKNTDQTSMDVSFAISKDTVSNESKHNSPATVFYGLIYLALLLGYSLIKKNTFI